MEYLWHNSTNEHKITYSRKGRFCFFLFFASPVAPFFHYFAQNVRVTPNLRKKGGEQRRASKKQFYYSKTPCEKKVPRRRAISSKYFSPLENDACIAIMELYFQYLIAKMKVSLLFLQYTVSLYSLPHQSTSAGYSVRLTCCFPKLKNIFQ